MLDRADCADFGCHNSIRLETKHFLNTLALTFISFSGRFVFAMQKHYLFFFASDPLVLIAPGWPNMPWFWDLVTISSQIPLTLPNLLTQPFNQIPHRNLTNLNLHAWLLEPQQSRSRASLKQWQQGLRLLKEDQRDQSMRQSGPFLQSGASLIRWTSGHPL